MNETIKKASWYTVYVYDYHGDADQALGDADAMALSVKTFSPDRALEIAKLEGASADWESGESDAEFAGYVEFTDIPKDALSINRKGR